MVKGGTVSAKKYRFESFNQRIAKLKIDPIRRARRIELETIDVTPTASYVKAGLDHWGDLNLSENFSNFLREAQPLCQSLPQILHYQQEIKLILVKYVEKHDPLSLEPLLDLLGRFAHDLGVRFESHFSETVTLITCLASKHSDVQVIEWSFTCLAWLFKYLSRLLVPDLQSLYQIMAPLLGREQQKAHTTRFAAEAMSFLLRKAALLYHKNQKPLKLIISCILDDLLSVVGLIQSFDLYQYGIMTLLHESMKGIDRQLNSSAVSIYCCLLECILEQGISQSTISQYVLVGVTTALIHHTEASTFAPILDIISESIQNQIGVPTDASCAVHARLIFVITTVRMASRIHDWQSILAALVSLIGNCHRCEDATVMQIFSAAAAVLQSAPLELVIPKLRIVMEPIASGKHSDSFLVFCNFFCEIGRERFHELILPYFSKFVIAGSGGDELRLLLSLPKVMGEHPASRLACPDAWEDRIIKSFEQADFDENAVVLCNAYIEVIEFMALSKPRLSQLIAGLGMMIQRILHKSSSLNTRTSFSLGQGMKFYFLNSTDLGRWQADTLPLVFSFADKYGTLPPYLEAVLLSVKANNFGCSSIAMDPLIDVLIENLHSSSHTLRDLSLKILKALLELKKAGGRDAEILTTACTIENSPLDLQSARTVSMHIRKLSTLYNSKFSQTWVRRVIVHFCFGLLTFKLSQVSDDAVLALKDICDTKSGEDLVSELAFRWIEEPGNLGQTDISSKPKYAQDVALNAFQCSNLMRAQNTIESIRAELKMALDSIKQKFHQGHQVLSSKVTGASALALRILLGAPQIAEKRSRQLVPKFLDLGLNVMQADRSEPQDDLFAIAERDYSKRKYRKTMLELFGLFRNPRALYRSGEVLDALRDQLANGDFEVQRCALKAIFNWKLQGIQPYQESLMNLLDDSRFREEIMIFLHDDEAIQEDHRHDLVPILLRILYGKMIAAGNSKRGQAVKRKAVLEALSRFGEKDLRAFVHLILGPLHDLEILHDYSSAADRVSKSRFGARKQVGFVNMTKDMLETLGDQLAPFARELLEGLLYCQIRAARGLSAPENGDLSQISMLKTIRQLGMQCLTLSFRNFPVKEIEPYVPTIFAELISPRLEKFPIETAQSVSGLLQLFSIWSSSPDTVHFLAKYNSRLMGSVIDCLEVPSAKEEVKLYILEEILKNIVDLCESPAAVEIEGERSILRIHTKEEVLLPNVDKILDRVGILLRKSPSKDLLGSGIELVSSLAPLVEGSSQVRNLLEISTFLLDQPSHRVNPRSKGNLLHVLQHFLPLIDCLSLGNLQDQIFRTISSLFGYFKDRANRLILSQVLSVLSEKDPELREIANMCASLNSFSARKIDEPDFNERLRIFNTINEVKYKEFSVKQWRPIVYNMLYYIKDTQELAIRSNASFALRRFVETNRYDQVGNDSSELVEIVLLPALRNGAFEASELVRAEYLAVFAHLIRHNPGWEEIIDMSSLLMIEDEEASFFSNVLHIQQHRRLRALRRLADEARRSGLRSANVAHFFIPLIEHFILNRAEEENAHNLAAEAVLTIGGLALSLEWPQFRALFRRYHGYISSKPDLEKIVIKLLGVIIDALIKAAEFMEAEVKSDAGEVVVEDTETSLNINRGKLSMTIPRQEKLAEDLSNNLLPLLLKYLHNKDESTVSFRVPVAVSTIKLVLLLPPDRRNDFLPSILTDVCNILRSRSQESRDLTRKTLVEISTLIGSNCFGFVLKELRGALARGYQLHVLSFTVHSILVATSTIFQPGDLDYCLPQIVAIIMDDIFGATGLEKDAEEYISKMKEVKSSKSYDSMELISKTASVEKFVHLIKPLQTLLEEKLDLKLVKKIDELLRRINAGLLRNEAIEDRRVLAFCHEIIREVYKNGGISNDNISREDYRNKRFLVNSKGASKSGTGGATSSHRYKLVRFSLELLRSVLHKYDALRTSANLSGFMPAIGDAIVDSNEEIQISGLRLLTTIIKVPLREIDDNAAIYIAECVKIFKALVSTNSELAHAALKLVSAVLRERSATKIKENDLAYLLKRLKPDLEEPDRQGVVFNFLKAVLARKVVIPEVYEVLDEVAVIMVTNQTNGARDLARGVYFQFLMEYPQGKGRFSKQLAFLVKNLDYKHQEGRQSVMEAVHLLFVKVGDSMVQDIVDAFMIPLVMVIVNDESAACREMAGVLLKTCFERADAKRSKSFITLLQTWLDQSDQSLLTRAALQLYNLYLEVNQKQGEKEIPLLRMYIARILKDNLADIANADWELMYFSLQTFTKLTELYHAPTMAPDFASLWTSVRQSLLFPHAWVKLTAAKLLGTLYADFARKNASAEELELPLQGSGGLRLKGEEITGMTRALLGLLRVPNVNEELANQSVKNLIFLGRTMGKIPSLCQQADEQRPETEDNYEAVSSQDEDDLETPRSRLPLALMLERCSALIRRGPLTTKASSLIPIKSSLLILSFLLTHLSLPILTPYLATILLPLHNLTDPTIPSPFSTDESFTTTYKALIANSSEMMSMLQKRMGTTEYVNILAKVREGVKDRREGRRAKRRIEAVVRPEKREVDKRRKGERKREKRKERSGEERGRRRGW